jgi:hypothetical protein
MSTSGANVFDRRDVEKLRAVLEQLSPVNHDLIAARGSLVASEPSSRLQVDCFSTMINNFMLTNTELISLRDLIYISSVMRDSSDEAFVLAFIKTNADAMVGLINQFRSYINETSNICYRNNLVATKAQQLLSIYGNLTSVIKEISRRM